MKLLHITFLKSHNCGAILQAWALNRVLELEGHVVAMSQDAPRCPEFRVFRRFPRMSCGLLRYLRHLAGWLVVECIAFPSMALRSIRAKAFLKKNFNFDSENLGSNNLTYDGAIIGSDQVWNRILTEPYSEHYEGRFLDGKLDKIGYAISIGDEEPTTERFHEILQLADSYVSFSVRESLLASILGRGGRCMPPVVVDPTLLLPIQEYSCLAYPKRIVRARYIYVYELLYEPYIHEFAEAFARKHGIKPVYSSVYQHGHFGIPKNIDLATSADRFLSYIRDAEYVLASSFHGTLFALAYGKRVLTMRNKPESAGSRVSQLYANFGIKPRVFVRGDDYHRGESILLQHLPQCCATAIEPMRNTSMAVLRSDLERLQK